MTHLSKMQLNLKTRFPYDTHVSAAVKVSSPTQANLRIRVPSWAAKEITVSVNGKTVGSSKPGTYLAVERKSNDEDVIEFVLPAEIRIMRYNGDDQIAGKKRYSVEYGPILLAAVGSPTASITVDKGHEAEHLGNHLEPVDGSPFTLQCGETRVRS